MERVSVSEAGRSFDTLVDRVSRSGITVELERDNLVIARLSPAPGRVAVADLNRLFAGLPSLGDDADAFAIDLEQARRAVPKEADSWD